MKKLLTVLCFVMLALVLMMGMVPSPSTAVDVVELEYGAIKTLSYDDVWKTYRVEKMLAAEAKTREAVVIHSENVMKAIRVLSEKGYIGWENLYEWALNNEAYYLIKLFKTETGWTVYTPTLSREKILKNSHLIYLAKELLTSYNFQGKEQKSKAASNLEFCDFVIKLIEKEVK